MIEIIFSSFCNQKFIRDLWVSGMFLKNTLLNQNYVIKEILLLVHIFIT